MKALSYLGIMRHLGGNTLSPPRLKNRMSLMRHYVRRSTSIPAFPTVLQIELSNRCNLECVMCPRQNMTRSVGDMSLEVFAKIIDEARGKAELAILHLLGESMMNPALYEMIRYCRDAGIRTSLSTNATLLDEEHAQRLADSPLDILILSLDGATAETYERVRQRGDFAQTVENIQGFLDVRRGSRPYTIVQMIELADTSAEKEDFLRRWTGRGVRALVKPFTAWQGDSAQIASLGSPKALEPLRHRVCDRAWAWLTVYQDGTVAPCCRDYNGAHPLGNVSDDSVDEIWNGDAMRAFRTRHLQGRDQVDICRTCDYDPVVSRSRPARVGLRLFDMHAVIRLMYDLKYDVGD